MGIRFAKRNYNVWVVVILIVIIILVRLYTLNSIDNLSDNKETLIAGKVVQAKAEIEIIDRAVEAYYNEKGEYPTSVDQLTEGDYFSPDPDLTGYWTFYFDGFNPIYNILAASKRKLSKKDQTIITFERAEGTFEVNTENR